MDFDKFLSHGTTVEDVINGCGGFDQAVDYMFDYIIVEAAKSAEKDGDFYSANEYRDVTKEEIRFWMEANK